MNNLLRDQCSSGGERGNTKVVCVRLESLIIGEEGVRHSAPPIQKIVHHFNLITTFTF